ncbi:hypothetical protein DH09_18700 [Bacillaceae bacterium JMAK1]|nr:hypothetical protein DH09_18700 [Bacillaceae bacterium JMAK1]
MWLIQELGMRESHNAKYYQFIEDNLRRYENNEPMLMMNVNDISADTSNLLDGWSEIKQQIKHMDGVEDRIALLKNYLNETTQSKSLKELLQLIENDQENLKKMNKDQKTIDALEELQQTITSLRKLHLV